MKRNVIEILDFILDAIATDIIYGGNERSIRAAQSYYNGVYGEC
jgi:hypothetical protein